MICRWLYDEPFSKMECKSGCGGDCAKNKNCAVYIVDMWATRWRREAFLCLSGSYWCVFCFFYKLKGNCVCVCAPMSREEHIWTFFSVCCWWSSPLGPWDPFEQRKTGRRHLGPVHKFLQSSLPQSNFPVQKWIWKYRLAFMWDSYFIILWFFFFFYKCWAGYRFTRNWAKCDYFTFCLHVFLKCIH